MRSSMIQSSIDAFPVELLDFILSEHQPDYDFHVTEHKISRRHRKPSGWQQYRQDVYFFAQLRSVNKSWYNFITPLLYSKFVLPTHPKEEFQRAASGFALHPDLVNHLVVRGIGGEGTDQHASERLSACFALCTNVRNLEIVDPKRILWHESEGKGLKLFRSLPQTMPLRSLVLRFLFEPDATVFLTSTILVGLGDLTKGLTELEVHKRRWYETVDRSAGLQLKLPPAFPNLERLCVTGGLHVDAAQLGRLLTRTVRVEEPTSAEQGDVVMSTAEEQKPKSSGKITSPLRDLTLRNFSYNRITRPEIITNLLTTNSLGLNLTTFRIRLLYSWDGVLNLEKLPFIIVKHCPALTTFLYMVPCPEHFLKRVPSTITTLGLIISQARPKPPHRWLLPQVAEQMTPFISSSDLIIEFICNKAAKMGLKKLIVEWDSDLRYQKKREPEIIEEACWVAEIDFDTDAGF